MTVRTIFTMAEDCGRGQRGGWQEFVRDYTPVTRVLLEQYFPMLKPELDVHITAVFERARAGDNAWFSDLPFRQRARVPHVLSRAGVRLRAWSGQGSGS